MGKQRNKPAPTISDNSGDRKNGKAWKKNPKMNPKPTGKTIMGYTLAKHAARGKKRWDLANADSSERV
jgi:hypothetical protein